MNKYCILLICVLGLVNSDPVPKPKLKGVTIKVCLQILCCHVNLAYYIHYYIRWNHMLEMKMEKLKVLLLI